MQGKDKFFAAESKMQTVLSLFEYSKSCELSSSVLRLTDREGIGGERERGSEIIIIIKFWTLFSC